jgi:hypothetical protein
VSVRVTGYFLIAMVEGYRIPPPHCQTTCP